jgi:hypothetical protein
MIPFSFDSPGNLHAAVLFNFVNAIQTGAELIAPAEQGIHPVELANTMIYSTVIGQPVNLPLDGQAYEQWLKRLIVNTIPGKQKD